MNHDTPDAAAYDPFAYEYHTDPYPVYRELRDERPVHLVERHGFWVLSRHADIVAALRNWQVYSSSAGNVVDDPPERIGRTLGTTDPPVHDELRAGVAPRFSNRAVRHLGEVVAESSRQLLASWEPGHEIDLVQDFAAPLTSTLMGDLLGVPREDHDQMRAWRGAMVGRYPDRMGFTDEGQAAFRELRQYMLDLVDRRADDPADDLLSDLLAASKENPTLNRDAIAVTALTVLGAGYQSMNYLISNALYAIGRFPAVRRELVEDPDLIGPGLEELMRWDSPTQGFARVLTTDQTLHGVTMRAGDRVLLLLASANRDERAIERPDEIDLHRGRVPHLSFGMGTHFCIGAGLGRLAGKISIEQFLARAPEFEVDISTADHIHSPTFRGLNRLRVFRTG